MIAYTVNSNYLSFGLVGLNIFSITSIRKSADVKILDEANDMIETAFSKYAACSY